MKRLAAQNEQCGSALGDEESDLDGANECADLVPFVTKGNSVFHVEYDKGVPGRVSVANINLLSDKAKTVGLSNVLKRKELHAITQYCP
jgi:hypothetical protein